MDYEINVGRILRSLPYEAGFHFTDEGVYTGITAISLYDFASKLVIVPVNSILFHFKRNDFQNWISSTLGDKELADQLALIQLGLSGEILKTQVLRVVKSRLNELEVLRTQKYLKHMTHVKRETK